MPHKEPLSHSPYLPFDASVPMYNASFGHLQPWEFSGWKEETMSWKESVYLHAGLNPPMPYRLEGPGAMQLLKDACINGFGKFSIGCSKHAVMCNELGNVMADGMVLRLGEEEFICFYLSPFIDYLVDTGRHDVKGRDVTGETFLFQLAGPLSLAVIESLTGESFRDLEFLWHRPSKVRQGGAPEIDIRVFRLGVARTLAYEVHGRIDDALPVYEAIMAVGEHLGIKRLGLQAYGMNHTEGGFMQSFIHFLPAYAQDEDLCGYLAAKGFDLNPTLPGSAGDDISKRYVDPVSAGWGHMIKFDHEFTGIRALEKKLQAPDRALVTLEWNSEDVTGVFASQFASDLHVQYMDFPANPIWQGNISTVFCDDVFVGGRLIGISSGRMFSQYYRQMISLCVIDVEHIALGTCVEVLWGDPSSDQKRIRATVARYPYLDLPFNRDIDVKLLP